MENRPDFNDKQISRSLKNWAAERPLPSDGRTRLLAAAAHETQISMAELPLEPNPELAPSPIPAVGVPWGVWRFLLSQQLLALLNKGLKVLHKPTPGYVLISDRTFGPYTQTRAWSLHVTEMLHQVT